ncbi:hypothetical protein DCAR_0103384 [Daucus carota subsp. sativus]|uniref:Reverse transcriptase domain-containing protein n=1 Tax=Daucus carota subsp. sativus TaxID=79200 RepID=A0AAF0W6P2_DAUCS|nr:hypothetical protein DCAR_0103384 [Daucus carota subsp. sativus]
MESGKRSDFQISNSQTTFRRSSGGDKSKQDVGDKLVNNFIWAHNHLVEKRVLERLNFGDRSAIQDALDQIHARSLDDNPFKGVRSYSEVLKNSEKGHATGFSVGDQPDPKEEEWQEVSYKRRQSARPKQGVNYRVTIFLHNIPENATGSQIWRLFKSCGHVLDIILPKKRDVRGSRYGFVHTISELEAGAIINNAKMDRALGGRISMSINGISNQQGRGQGKANWENKTNPKDFGKKMFEFTELEIDEEVETALLECKIGFSWFEESATIMQERLNDIGLENYRITSLSKRKESDHIISKVTWIECKGLPMPAWKDENLKAITSRFGEWISWTYQSDSLNEFFNPLICIDTVLPDNICDRMKVLPMEFSNNQEHVGSVNTQKDVTGLSHSERISSGSVTNGPLPIIEMPMSKEQDSKEKIIEGGGLIKNLRVITPTSQRHSSEFRSYVSSPEESSNTSHQHDSLPGSEICNSELNSSIQTDLCIDVSKKLRVKSNRGRPKKVNNGVRNPFEIGIKFKGRKRKAGGGRKVNRSRRVKEAPNCLQIVSTKLTGRSTMEALEIIRSAELMGLEIKGDRELAVKEIARKLDNGEFHVVSVYSPLDLSLKMSLWEDIRNILSLIDKEPLAVVGDFNCIRRRSEQGNCVYSRKDMDLFDGWIEDCNLLELPLLNDMYTWFGPVGKKSKLDRILVNHEWFQTGNWNVKSLSRKHSDHSPLFTFMVGMSRVSKPFKIFNCFLTEELFEGIQKEMWRDDQWRSQNIHVVLKRIKTKIKEMTRGSRDKINTEILALENKLRIADNSTVDQGWKTQGEIREQLLQLYSKRESMLKQKARLSWLKLGDGNTSFFHRTVQIRRHRNNIKRIIWNDVWISDPEGIKRTFFQFFSSFYKLEVTSPLGLGMLTLPWLEDHAKSSLIKPILVQEVEAVLHNLEDDKAPGPDGLNIRSLKFLWPIIKSKIMCFLEHFQSTATLPTGINASFIALIPKIAEPTLVNHYRPISLINSAVKLLTKILASRLACHMNAIVSDSQTGFIKGRQASESILLVKEIVHSIQKGKGRGMVLKLDFEKAFDTVKWEFLFEVLAKMNFDQKWIGWIKGLLETARVSILVNGSPTKEFVPSRGLRQGDPLSPLLFNLVGEVLSSMLHKTSQKGIFKGFSLGKAMQPITHLQFADDTIVFVDNTLESISGVKKVLQCFQMISGLKINYEKSEIFAHNSSFSTQMEGARIFGCKVGQWPMTYLGVPIGISSKRRIFWEPLVKKFHSKLATWKADILNLAGRTTLVKSVLDSLPTYWLGLHMIPPGVCDKIERIRRDFLWGSVGGKEEPKRKIHAIRWSRICLSKDQGGLGLVPIKVKNLALLGKWSFRWDNERHRNWNIWIRGKYNCSKHSNLQESLFCSWWNFEDDFLEGLNPCNLWDSAKLIRYKKAKFAWQVVISATLWVIWLSRNDAIFNNVPVHVRHNLIFLKSLAREWCLAENLITVSSTTWWDHNPMGSITKSEDDQMKALSQVNWDLIAFLDGSWKILQGSNQAGIGGYIQQKNGNAIFSFSGPSSACSAFQAEWNALTFLLTNFAKSRWSDHSLLIYSDCKSLICKFLELFTSDVEEEYIYLARLIKPMKVYIKLISRDLNCRADMLAKQGAHNSQMAHFWAHN